MAGAAVRACRSRRWPGACWRPASLQLLVQWPSLARLGLLPRLQAGLRPRRRASACQADAADPVRRPRWRRSTCWSARSSPRCWSTGSQTWLYLSDRLLEFPLGMFGVAIGTVILPHLSRRHAATDAEGYSRGAGLGPAPGLLVGVPAGAGPAAAGRAADRAWSTSTASSPRYDTRMAAISLSAMSHRACRRSCSQGAGAGVLRAPGHARRRCAPAILTVRRQRRPDDRASPSAAVAVRGAQGAHGGIALATGIAGIFNAWLLWRYLRRAGLMRAAAGLGRASWLRLALACLVMAAVVLALRCWVGDWTAMPSLLASRVAGCCWWSRAGGADLRGHAAGAGPAPARPARIDRPRATALPRRSLPHPAILRLQ